MPLFSFAVCVFVICIRVLEFSCLPVGVYGASGLRYQVDIELLRFENAQGLEINGLPCDPMKQGCDTRFFAYLDWIKPDEEWPGFRDFEEDDTVFEVAEAVPTSFDINKIFIAQLCTGNHSQNNITLRVKVQDDDRIFRGSDDLIGNFNCRFAVSPEKNVYTASWSEPTTCEAVKYLSIQPTIRLTFRTKMFFTEGECVDLEHR
ncbi:uncharacterized protein LOC129581538 [Paramacrobiotus metropolitanus]|uniref:uncharacterized protein LOC129581538 n=1 Tax=Paramacrobiotus metropolitanus TaxID=2943436 RepID=UPI00244598AF|nr:uncharacterized protein LOC129581538 [Paramacrobiotus metropolitanus]